MFSNKPIGAQINKNMRNDKSLLDILGVKNNRQFIIDRQVVKNRLLQIKLVFLCLFIFLQLTPIFSQSAGNENTSDRTLRGTGKVNSSTLAMEFDLPFGSYPGRGINIPIGLSYSSKVWRNDPDGSVEIQGVGGSNNYCLPASQMKFAEKTAAGWTTSLAVPYIEYVGLNTIFDHNGIPTSFSDVECATTEEPPNNSPDGFIKRLVVHLPSGETHELRADDAVNYFAPGTGTDSPYYAPN